MRLIGQYEQFKCHIRPKLMKLRGQSAQLDIARKRQLSRPAAIASDEKN
jgi:hypothetical protein